MSRDDGERRSANGGRARRPKQLTWIETHNHIELDDQQPYVTQATTAVTDFLAGYLPDPRLTREM